MDVNTEVKASAKVIDLINQADGAATSSHETAILAANMAYKLTLGADPKTKNETIRRLYQPTLDGKNGAVRDAFYNRVATLCFQNVLVEIPLDKTEIKALKEKSPKSTVTTKKVKAGEVIGKNKLAIAARQVREHAGIAKKQPNKAQKPSQVKSVNMPVLISDLAIALKGKETLNQIKSALEALGFRLTAIRKVSVMPVSAFVDRLQGSPALLGSLNKRVKGSIVHTIM